MVVLFQLPVSTEVSFRVVSFLLPVSSEVCFRVVYFGFRSAPKTVLGLSLSASCERGSQLQGRSLSTSGQVGRGSLYRSNVCLGNLYMCLLHISPQKWSRHLECGRGFAFSCHASLCMSV